MRTTLNWNYIPSWAQWAFRTYREASRYQMLRGPTLPVNHDMLELDRLEYIADRLSRRLLAAFTELSMMSDIPTALKWIISESNKGWLMFSIISCEEYLWQTVLLSPALKICPFTLQK